MAPGCQTYWLEAHKVASNKASTMADYLLRRCCHPPGGRTLSWAASCRAAGRGHRCHRHGQPFHRHPEEPCRQGQGGHMTGSHQPACLHRAGHVGGHRAAADAHSSQRQAPSHMSKHPDHTTWKVTGNALTVHWSLRSRAQIATAVISFRLPCSCAWSTPATAWKMSS